MSETNPAENVSEEKKEVQSNSEPEYVVVANSPNDEPIELPLNADDNTLSISTLSHAFPGAHGLKFKNPKTGASRALLIDSTNTKFVCPVGGWNEKVFIPIYHQEPAKRVMPGEQKRKKMMDDNDVGSSDSEDGSRNLHGAQVAKLQRLNKDEDENPESDKKHDKFLKEPKKGAVCSDLLILGLPFKLEKDELQEYFEKNYGSVNFVEIKTNSGGQSRGFGFVRMNNMADQIKILDAPSHTIGGRKVHVKYPVAKATENKEENVRLFIGRLSKDISVKRLREYFSAEARKVDPQVLITDTFIPNPFRGFGFINLSSTSVAKELLKKDDFVIDDCPITISIAAPKAQQQQQSYSSQYDQTAPQQSYYDRSFDQRTGYYGEHYGGYPADPWEMNNRPNNRYYGNEGFESSPYETGYPPNNSNSISTGLETLNLNNMKPEVMNEALKAFWNAASSRNGGSHGPPSNFHPPARQGRSHGSNGPRNQPPSWR